MTTAHEIGHFLNFAGMDPPAQPLKPGLQNFQSVRKTLPEMHHLLARIRESETMKEVSGLPNAYFSDHLLLTSLLEGRYDCNYE